MIDPDEILSLDELVNKFGDKLKSNSIDDNLKENMALSILDNIECEKEKYKDKIKDIYISIIDVKIIDSPICDVHSIVKLLSAINYLKSDSHFYLGEEILWTKKDLCEEALKELMKESIYSKYINIEIKEDFGYDHLLDAKYHLDNFRKYAKNKNFIDVLDKELWRYL